MDAMHDCAASQADRTLVSAKNFICAIIGVSSGGGKEI